MKETLNILTITIIKVLIIKWTLNNKKMNNYLWKNLIKSKKLSKILDNMITKEIYI